MNPDYAALSASDGVGESVRATVQAARSIGSLTIDVDNTTNWPTGTFIATTGTLLSSGKLDPTTAQVFYGTASGTDITITAFAAGYSDLGNEINDVVVIKPTTEWANIVAQGIVNTGKFPANFDNFVEATTGLWSAGSGLVGSGTAGFVWYQGTRSSMAAVTGHTFTASKDTYIDYNPATSSWTYVPETNGATEPAVTASSVRVAKVVTGSSTITSVSQTEYNNPTPLVWKYLGDAKIVANNTTSSTSPVAGSNPLGVTVNIPANVTKVRITINGYYQYNDTTADWSILSCWLGAVGSGTQLGGNLYTGAAADYGGNANFISLWDTPVAGVTTFNLGIAAGGGGNANLVAASGTPARIIIEVC